MKHVLITTGAIFFLQVINAHAEPTSRARHTSQAATTSPETSSAETPPAEPTDKRTKSEAEELNKRSHEPHKLRTPFETSLSPANLKINKYNVPVDEFDLAVSEFCEKLGYKQSITFRVKNVSLEENVRVICYD